jgi:hypothetical protein
MTKTRRSFFTLASSSVLTLALGAGPVFADSWSSSGGGSSGGWSHHTHHGGGGVLKHHGGGGWSSVLSIGGFVHHVQFIAGVYPKGHSPI